MTKIYVVANSNELKLLDNFIFEPNDRIIVTGVGFSNVYKTLSNLDKTIPIINVGYCGSNILPIGTQCDVVKSETFHPKFEYCEQAYGVSSVQSWLLKKPSSEKVKCYTSTDFVTACDYEEPCVFDMELYFICALGFLDVRSVKWVSDNLSVEEYSSSISE